MQVLASDRALRCNFLFCLFPVLEQVAYPKWLTSEIENSNHGREFAINGIVNAKRKSF